MMLDQVISALGLTSDAALSRKLGLCRSTAYHWRRKGIPAARRFQLAEMIKAEGGKVPKGLLDPGSAMSEAA